ncbi:MAG: SAM-dependent chlorinase/fluorinase [Prevotellaceae bacterium]|nr:SAM-dependent chlorinase/fluorinase [Prevotellaceae bacterium]
MDKTYYEKALDDKNLPLVYLIGDHYVAQLKGCLRQLSANIEIFDICNTVQAFNLLYTGYILRTTYPFFPAGTIHLIGVNSEPSATNKILLVKHEDHYFVGADNGLYDIIFEDCSPESALAYELVPEMMYRFVPDLAPTTFFNPDLELNTPKQFSGFSAIKIFATVVNHIMNNKDISLLGKPVNINTEKKAPKAIIKTSSISGNVIFIDHFGNIITNISRELFDSVGKGRPFGIFIRGSRKFAISAISTDYSVIGHEQKYLAIFNSSGLLEIAQLHYNLAQVESIDILADVVVNFSNEEEETTKKLFY